MLMFIRMALLNCYPHSCHKCLNEHFVFSGFEIGSLPHTLQTDSINCGVPVCWYAMRLVNGKSFTDWCKTSVMRITIYKQIRGTCLQRCSGCRHIELSKCPICKVELQMGDTRFQCRRCCQSYHAICLKADQKPPVNSIRSANIDFRRI